ncbi:MAG: PrpR N-terminal domain-containing protein [Eubacteriales bacterium]|jgi:DNA-binding NtrC family response regulator
MSQKTKALFVGAYRQLGEQAREIAQERDDIEVDVKEANHLNMDRLNEEISKNGYHVLIGRGEATEVLRSQLDIPVIDITVSAYDVMKVLKTVQDYSGKIAIVNHRSLMGDIPVICQLMHCKADVFSVKSANDAVALMENLREQQYSLVIGGYTMVMVAKRFGINGIILPSGRTSVQQALDRAVYMHRQLKTVTQKNAVYEDVILYSGQYTMVFEKDGGLLYSSMESIHTHYDYVMKTARVLMENAVLREETLFYREHEDIQWIFFSKLLQKGEKQYLVYYIRSTPKNPEIHQGALTIRGADQDSGPFFNPFIGLSQRVHTLMQDAQLYGKSDCSVLLTGKEGTGKEQLAQMMHTYSRYRDYAMVILQCELLDEAQMDAIFQGESSVFAMMGKGTLVLNNLQALDLECQRKLYQALTGNPRLKNYRLISTARYSLEEDVASNRFYYKLYKKVSELELVLPTLQERTEDIESLANVLIAVYNQEFGTSVIGLDKKALALLKAFDWKTDVEQCKRVIRSVVLTAAGTYVTEAEMEKILQGEQRQVSAAHAIGKNVDFTGTLDEIMNDVVRAIVEEEQMNQSKAAKRLGVSRSTVWRRMK